MAYTAFPFELFVNDSGIQLDAAKENARPDGVTEIDGYTEMWRADGNCQAVRIFDVPWAIKKTFVDWVLGYTVAVPIDEEGNVTNYGNPEGGGYTAGVLDPFAATGGGALLREIPSQHPEYPWLYAVECELEKGLGAITNREDITVIDGAAGLPFVAWDNGGYTLEGGPDPDEDPEVIAARAELAGILERQTRLTTFPLSAHIADVQDELFVLLGYAGGVPGDELPFYEGLIGAQSMAQIQQFAGLGSPVAIRFLAGLASTQAEVAAGEAYVAAVVAAAEAATPVGRQLVPMIAYVTKPTTRTGAAPLSYGLRDYPNDGLARFRVTYRPLPYEVRTDRMLAEAAWLTKGEMERYVLREVKDSVKALQIPAGSLKYWEGPSVGVAVPSPGTILIGMQELVYTWTDVPDLPEDAIAACVGRVNSSPFDGAFGAPEYAAETVLCQAPERIRKPRGLRGRVMWDIKFHFLINPRGWNKFPTGTGEYYGATFGGAAPNETNVVYKLADFRDLFKAPTPRDYQTAGRG